MAGTKNQRIVSLIELRATKYPAFDVIVDFNTLLKIVIQAYEQNKAIGWATEKGVVLTPDEATNERDIIYIADIADVGGVVTMVFTHGLPEDSPPGWANVKTLKVSPSLPPDRNSVSAKSAHFAVALKSTTKTKQGPIYRAAYEMIDGVSRTWMTGLMNALVKKYAHENAHEFVYVKETGKGKNKKKTETVYTPSLQAMAHFSDSLKEDVEAGNAIGLELAQKVEKKGKMDAPLIIDEIGMKLTVKIEKTKDMSKIGKMANWLIERYSSNSPDPAEVRIILDTERGQLRPKLNMHEISKSDAKDMLYSRSKVIDGFKNELQGCVSKANPEIVDKLKQLLFTQKYW